MNTSSIIVKTNSLLVTIKSILLFFSASLCCVFLISCKSKQEINTKAPASSNYRESPEESKFKGYYIEACRHKALGNVKQALENFNLALKIFPENSAVHYEIGNVYRYAGNLELATKFAKYALDKDSKNAWYHLLYIECLHAAQKYNAAAEACEKLVKLFPDNLEYYNRLADELENAGKLTKALEVYEQMDKKFNAEPEQLLNRVSILKALRKNGEAELLLLRLVKENPGQYEYLTELANLYRENNRKEKAFQIYKEIIAKDPGNPYVHLSLADYYRTQKNDSAFYRELKQAFYSPVLEMDEKSKILISFYSIIDNYPEYREWGLELCKITLEVHPEDARAHSIYADYLSREGQLEQAREHYLLALKFEPDYYVIWQEIMKIDVEISDFQALEEHSKQAYELFPLQNLPLFYLGAAKIQLKKYDEGISILNEAKVLLQEDTQLLAQVYINLVDAYNSIKKFKESDEAFEQAIKLDKDNAYLLNNYSYYLSLRKEKLELAAQLSDRANKIDTKNPQFLDTYAWIMFQQGKFEEAKTWIQKAVEIDSAKNGVILEHYGDVLFRLNEIDQAVVFWKKSKQTGRHSEWIDRKINDRKLYE